MKRFISLIMTIMLVISSVIVLRAAAGRNRQSRQKQKSR